MTTFTTRTQSLVCAESDRLCHYDERAVFFGSIDDHRRKNINAKQRPPMDRKSRRQHPRCDRYGFFPGLTQQKEALMD
jgi:hypothetical protein